MQDVSDNMELKSPRINLVIDRDKAAAVGLNATQIENALNAGLGPRWSTTLYGQRAQYRVLLELDPKFSQQADSLERIAFKAPNGNLIPLESVVRWARAGHSPNGTNGTNGTNGNGADGATKRTPAKTDTTGKREPAQRGS